MIKKFPKFLWITLLIVGMSVIYSFIGIQKHFHFQTFGWDTAVFDQQIYFFAHLQAPYSSLMKMNDLGDHFQLITIVLGAISYLLWQNVNALFILQACVACLSALPLYLIAQKLLRKTKLLEYQVALLSLAVAIAYLISVPFQSMLTDEFHNEPLIVTPLIFTIYFLMERNWGGYWVNFILVTLNKEMFGLLGIPLGIYTYLKTKNLKQGLLTGIIGVGITLTLLFYIMPKIAGVGTYVHFDQSNNPSYLLHTFSRNPSLFLTEMGNTEEKRTTIIASLLAFGFLPLLAPTELILPIFSLAIRFYDNTSPRLHAFNNHYAAPFLPLLAICAVFGLYNLAKWLERKKLLSKVWWVIFLYILCFTAAQNYLYHGPINSIFKSSFYHVQPWEHDAHLLIKEVPDNVTIATQNSLLPHLSERKNFYLLPEIGDAAYIAVDLTDGPNKFSPLTYTETNKLITDLIQQKKYQIVWQRNQSLLLKKD